MELILIIGLALSGYAIMQPSTGIYQITTDGTAIIRMDTRTGKMERCSGSPIECKPVEFAPK